MELERHWHGIPNPWDRFLGQTFGKYTLMSYHNLPNADPSNIPPSYEFVLSRRVSGEVYTCHIIHSYSILDMEKQIFKMVDE